MGERIPDKESSLWGAYRTLLILLVTAIAIALFAGAGGAMTDGQEATQSSEELLLDSQLNSIHTIDSEAGQFENESDSVLATDTEINVTHLTTQIGESTVSEGVDEGAVADMDLMMVPEQSIAMYTEWGSYYPASGPVSQLAENTEIITESSVSDVESQSYTAVGDLLDVGLEVDGVYDFGCQTETRYTKDWAPWESQDYDWCGWHEDSGTADGNIYHIDADTQLSLLQGFDIDRDNTQFDEMILTDEGDWQELPTEDRGVITGLFGNGLWEWTNDDTPGAYKQEQTEFENISDDSLENNLNYIEYSSGADVWGFNADNDADEIIRLEYDAPFSTVHDMQPVDPSDDRYSAMYTIVDILEASDQEHNMGLVANGEVNQGLTENYDEVEDEVQELEMFGDLDEDTMYLNLTDGLEAAANELDEEGEHENQTIVFVGNAHEPMVPDDEWYEVALDSVRDAILPDFLEDSAIDWGEQAADRPDRAEAGEEFDEELREAASEIADEDGVELVTMGIGENHDAARLGMMADEADGSTTCQDSGLNDEECNYISVENTGDIEPELVDLLLDDDIEFEIDRNHVDINAVGDTDEDLFEDVNDPEEFRLNNHNADNSEYQELETNVGDDIDFEVDIAEAGECDDEVSETETFGDVGVEQEHSDCSASADTLLTVDSNLVFTDGDDLSVLDQLPDAGWIERAGDVVNGTYDEYVEDGALDLDDSSEGTTGYLVGIPVADEGIEGYSLLHVEMERAPTTDFQVDIEEDQLEELNDQWEDIDDRSGKPAGETVDVSANVTNYGDDGEETVLLQREGSSGNPVLDYEEDLHLNESESESVNLSWETDDGDAGYDGSIIVNSESASDDHPISLFGEDLDLSIENISVGKNGEYSHGDGELNLTVKVNQGETVPVNVTIQNTGFNNGSAPIALQIGDTVYTEAMNFEEVGDEGAKVEAEFGWSPNYGDIDDFIFADQEVGGTVIMQANTVGDLYEHEQEVVYLPPEQEVDVGELEEGDIEPVDIDIDEIEIE